MSYEGTSHVTRVKIGVFGGDESCENSRQLTRDAGGVCSVCVCV